MMNPKELLKSMNENFDKNITYLKDFAEFPIKEHTLFAIYYQTYMITFVGFPTASLNMQGLLSEMFVNFLYFHHTKRKFKGKLCDLIKTCHDNNFFSADIKKNEAYFEFFDKFRDKVRNVQAHFLSEKQTKGIGVYGMKIDIPNTVHGEDLLRLIKDAKENFPNQAEIMMTDDNPAIANVMKFELDSQTYVPQFKELLKVILDLTKEHNLS